MHIEINQLVQQIRELTGNKTTKVYLKNTPTHQSNLNFVQGDLKKLQNLGWLPKISLSQGLKDVFNQN
jgi:nucleoside-diphosphate-sugar epimerase